MSQSIYSGLKPTKNPDKEMYKGNWNGHNVEFERVFRGYRFSDEECEALCRNEMLEVHGLERDGVKYSVAGCLRESAFAGFSTDFVSVKFKVDHTISYNPEYRFENRRVMKADGAMVTEEVSTPEPKIIESSASSDDEFINNFDPSAFDSLSDEMDAKMVAMLSAPLLPPVIQVQGHGEMPVFIPVFKLLTEELLAEAAARAAKQLEQNPDPYYAKTVTAMA